MSKTMRMKTRDAAFTYRMGAGYPGDVDRTHPASIEPNLIDSGAPPTAYGQGVIVDGTSHAIRPLTSGDSGVTELYGITVRPYPTQQSSGTNYGAASLGSATPPTSGIVDVIREGYVMASIVGSPVKNGPVYIWTAASSGNHVQGGFEAADGTTNTASIANAVFNGPADANGVGEIFIHA